jgi:hypothetical protein
VSDPIILKDVRLSVFKNSLRVATQFDGVGEFKYQAHFLIEPGSENDKAIRAAIQEVAQHKWKDKAAAALKGIEGQKKEYCYLSGDSKEYAGYAGMMVLSTTRYKNDGPVKVIDRQKNDLDETSGKPYSGCYVNAKVQLRAQDNQWGKGMRCGLIAVQFVRDGDAFSGSGPANDTGFEAIEEEASDLM